IDGAVIRRQQFIEKRQFAGDTAQLLPETCFDSLPVMLKLDRIVRYQITTGAFAGRCPGLFSRSALALSHAQPNLTLLPWMRRGYGHAPAPLQPATAQPAGRRQRFVNQTEALYSLANLPIG